MQVTDNDAQLQLKKRARRRLVGAVAFVTFAAIVLPMVMDQAPPPPTPDVQIRIPGQDQTVFNPQALNAPTVPAKAAPAAPKAEVAVPPVVAVTPDAPAAPPAQPAPAAKVPEKVAAEKPVDKPVEKPAEKASAKPADKAAEKLAAEKAAAEKAANEKAKADAEAKRAAALLGGGKSEAKAAPAAGAAAGGQHVILIGAFANQGNVKVLQSKLSEIGVKTYTEPLESPQGLKTRVRAGPFPSKDAADKALEKMKKIGVSGIVSAK